MDIVEESKTKLAVAMAEYHLLQERYFAESPGCYTSDSLSSAPEQVKVLAQKMKHKIGNIGKEVAAIPVCWNILVPWMVDVKGKGGPKIQKLLKKLEHNDDWWKNGEGGEPIAEPDVCQSFLDEITASGGIQNAVIKAIGDKGYRITDAGGGGGRWHIGVPCTEKQSTELTQFLYQKFAIAIKIHLIKVVKSFWGFKFPDLYNEADAYQYCIQEGIGVPEPPEIELND